MQSASRTASSSTRPGSSPLPRTQQTHVNTQTKVIDTNAGRILCVADVRGKLSSLSDMAREAGAKAIIHTGDFGFFESSSLARINDRTLKHLTQYSPLIPNAQRNSLLAPEIPSSAIREAMTVSLLSELPLLLSGQLKLDIPVFTVWGACEDVEVLEKFRLGMYDIENLHVIDEATTRCLDIGGVKLRLLGLGGAFVPHKMFDNGEGNATIAGGQGTMWTTALQIGELVDTAQRVYDPTETRLLITHASPGREGIIAQLALVLKADLTISAGLHFRYPCSWNEFSVQGDFEGFRHKILNGKESFDKIWESVKPQVEAVVDENQRILLEKALSVIERVPAGQPHLGPGGTATGDEPAWKNCWNWNLCDAAYGSLVLDVKEGRVSAELKSQGFNYAYRRSANVAATPTSATNSLPNNVPVAVKPSDAGAAKPATLSHEESQKATPPTPTTSQPDTGKEAAEDLIPVRANGDTSAPAPSVEAADMKNKREKEKKRDKRSKDKESAEETEAKGDPSSAPPSGKATPVDGKEKVDGGASPTSPGAGPESSGARTPTSRKASKNPWTIFMKFGPAATETDIRDFFGDAKEGIIRVTLPKNYGNKPYHTAFVEFGDEDTMKAGLEKRKQELNGEKPHVDQAFDQPSYMRGRGRGRGSGFAVRGFAAAGLMRQQQTDKKSAAS